MTWATLGVVGFFALLGVILTLTLWIDLSSAINRVCNQYGGEISSLCKQSLNPNGIGVPAALVVYLVILIVAGLVALTGAVLLFLKKYVGHYLILGGGVAMLLFAIIGEAQYGSTGRLTYDLIAGLLIAAAGGLMFVPQLRILLGLPPLSSGSRPGQFGAGQYGGIQYGQYGATQYGQYSGGQYGQYGGEGQPGYGQAQPGQYGQPGQAGYPPRQW